MKISELIEELIEIRKVHGDIEVLAISDTYGEGDWASLEDSGVSLIDLMRVRTLYILVGNGIQDRQTNKEPNPA